jgi:hypothetical protein
MADFDLHTHSVCSDGTLTPRELVARAAARGVRTLALTDHDTVAGLDEAASAARQHGIAFVRGVELSARFGEQVVHVVGLGIDPGESRLREGLARQQAMRAQRAAEIGRRLAKLGLAVTDRAFALAGPGQVTRTHYARALLQARLVGSMQEAFDRYLGRGRPAYVKADWATLEEAVAWIAGSGGVAVLAHPARYKLSAGQRDRLLAAFREAGGAAMEVATGNATRDELHCYADLARRHGLRASLGSDFHDPAQTWIELGRLPELPAGLVPVWEDGLRAN